MRQRLSLCRIGTAFLGAIIAIGHLSTPVAAADKELLDILLTNGAIDQEQYEELLKKEELTKDDVLVTLNEKGFRLKSADGDFAMKIGARLHFQASAHEGDTGVGNTTDGTEIRRARFELSGKMYQDWIWAAEADFADNDVSVKDWWLGYTGLGPTKLYAGHAKQPYSLSLEMSSNDLPFIERSVANDLVVPFVDRALGIRGERSGDNWFFAGGLFGESVSSSSDADDEGWGAAARLVIAPLLDESRVLHLGVRGAYREPHDSDKTIGISAESTHMSNLKFVNTGDISDVDSTTLAGAEASYAAGPFWLLGEYNRAFISRSMGGDLEFDSWTVSGAWVFTGAPRAKSYKMGAGELKRFHPKNNFSLTNGHWGAWELAGRIAALDATDGAVSGGETLVWSTALNWYVNPSIRMMLDWSRLLDSDDSGPFGDDVEDLNIFQFRTQLTF